MPPTLPNRLTKEEYVLFNDMITRIRVLEHIATTRFLRGDSERRTDVACTIEKAVKTVQSEFFSTRRDNVGRRRVARVAPASVDPAALGHGCTFPYCPSGGTCEMCGLAEVRQEVLDAFTS